MDFVLYFQLTTLLGKGETIAAELAGIMVGILDPNYSFG